MPSSIVLVGYGTSFYFLGLTLQTIPVGIAYAIWSGIGILLITAIGSVAFGQSLDFAALSGTALIVAGVGVIHLFPKSVPH